MRGNGLMRETKEGRLVSRRGPGKLVITILDKFIRKETCGAMKRRADRAVGMQKLDTKDLP